VTTAFDTEQVEPFHMDALTVPLIRMTLGGLPPDSQISVDGEEYAYDRSYPIKGHSAVMPAYIQEQIAAGKKPMVIERPDRFYVYFAT
jgi:hypothetical protein